VVVRFYAHFAVYAGRPQRRPVPQSGLQTYLHAAVLAADNFQHPLSPALFFGTYDCAHYSSSRVIKFCTRTCTRSSCQRTRRRCRAARLRALCVVLPDMRCRRAGRRALATLVAFGINDLLKTVRHGTSMLALWRRAADARDDAGGAGLRCWWHRRAVVRPHVAFM